MDLEVVVDLLEKAYLAAQDNLVARYSDIPPMMIMDANGRYVLLDALTALAQAKSALRYQELVKYPLYTMMGSKLLKKNRDDL